MENIKPILVTGSHRSGTTWIGKTVTQHKKVRYVHEPFNVSFPNKVMGLELDTWFCHYNSSSQKSEICKSFNNLLQANSVRKAMASCKGANLNIGTPSHYLKHFFSEVFSSSRILVKDPIAILSAGWLYDTYDFNVIVMIRNPLAFVGSLKVAGWEFFFEDLQKQENLMKGLLNHFSDNIESVISGKSNSDFIDKACLLWNILHYAILQYQRKYPEWLFVNYENIAMDPGAGFRQIFDYLEMEMDINIKNYIDNYTSQKNPKESASTSYQPRNSKSSLYTWKDRLSSREIERVTFATKEIASIFYKNILN